MLRAIAVIVALVGSMSGNTVAWAGQVGEAAKSVASADVISMTAAKLSDDVIMGAIRQATTTDFDLSPAGLIALRNAGVSDRVMQSMQARVEGRPRQAEAGSPSSAPCGIFITEEDPPSASYVVVRKEVQAGKKFYGSHDDQLMKELAIQAGADAIIKFHEWRAPSMWSWAAAKAGGMAVKWTAEGMVGVAALKGQCWSPEGQDLK